ncbi:MAG: hypothetical protein K8T91_18470 [Planctomycetes bacterium]|nr:hypothetical protein [Planctomycetota bacterium]
MRELPQLTEEGLLPAGIHQTTLPEVKARFGGTLKREEIWGNFDKMLADAKEAGLPVKKVIIAGSATTAKPLPGDFDVIVVIDKPRPSITDPAQRKFLDETHMRRTYKGDVFVLSEDDPAFKNKLDFFSKTKEDLTPRGVVEVQIDK